jgi:hypothetical protein
MNVILAKEILNSISYNLEIMDFLEEMDYDIEICKLSVNYLNGEAYLLQVFEKSIYSLEIAELILPKLTRRAALEKFMDMVFYHSQKLFRKAMNKLLTGELVDPIESYIEVVEPELIQIRA